MAGPRRGALVVVAALAIGAVAATSGADDAAASDATDRAGTVVEEMRNGSFETPSLRPGAARTRPRGGGWEYVGRAGVVRAGHPSLASVPAPPRGQQAAFIDDTAAVMASVSVMPGDVIVLRATQRRVSITGPQRLGIFVDGRSAGSFVPSSGAWSSHALSLGITARGVVTLEIRGAYPGEGESRGAFVDDVRLTRRPTAIPTGGLAAEARRLVLSDRTTPTQSGVRGDVAPGDTDPDIDTPVQAFAEWGDRIYVGGKFTEVEVTPGGRRVSQSFLAAFDRTTGAWIPGFRPRLDGAVWDLAVTPAGLLVVGGQFRSVDGVNGTRALAALDPVTGAVAPGWRANLGLTGSTARPRARSLDVHGDWVYVGGNFTRVGPDADPTRAGRLARVSVVDGSVDRTFLPDVQNGTVASVDATDSAVWIAGDFTSVAAAGVTRSRSVIAKLDLTHGRPLPTEPYRPTHPEPGRQYAFSVLEVDGTVWLAGSQHALQAYRASDMRLLRQWINFPIGDAQDVAVLGGIVYVGTHAGAISSTYADAPSWDSVAGATGKDASMFLNAFDARQRRHLTGWQTDLGVLGGEGAWEVFVDSARCMWAGGDFTGGSPTPTGRSFAQGFVRFCPTDSTPPPVPVAATARVGAGGVTVRWSSVNGVRHEVWRNDRLVGVHLGRREFTDRNGRAGDRYFVRAVDAAGNRSATTAAVVAG